jgi:5-methylthioadenosine/S-adenosylhomocysteine deaminase
MNLSRMREVGIKVGLGSDSLASNNSLDLWKEMRLAQFQGQRILDDSKGKGKPSAKNVEDLLRMATLGGAESLGLQSMIGSIEKGKAADLIAVDLTHAGGFTNPTGELVFSARTEDVLFTMVGGQTLYENARAQSLDEETIRKKAAATRDRIKPA